MLWVPDHRSSFTTCAHRTPGPVLRQCGKLGLIKTVQHTTQGTQECRQTHVRGNTRLAGVLRTVAALSGTLLRVTGPLPSLVLRTEDMWQK